MHQQTNISEDKKHRIFTEAFDLLNDGEYEEACNIFKFLVDNFPDDRGLWWQYIACLRKARFYEEADQYTTFCHQSFPDDLGFMLEWTRSFDGRANWDEALQRRYIALQTYSPEQEIKYLPLVTELFLPLVEKKEFKKIKELLDKYWELFFEVDNSGAFVYFALEAIGDYKRQIELCDRFLTKCDALNPIISEINYANLRVIAQSALWNQEILKNKYNKINILSFGQSCLPYTIANRWGLIKYVGIPEEITIFDLGAFGRNTSVDALLENFESYLKLEDYSQGFDPMKAPQMTNRLTGVHFGHERGVSIIGENKEKFLPLILKKINAFQNFWKQKKCLLIYAIVGQCDVNSFINNIEPLLEKNSSRLLIINCTRLNIEHSESSYVTYAHIPFPIDYNWNSIADYTTNIGLSFDVRVVNIIRSELDKMN